MTEYAYSRNDVSISCLMSVSRMCSSKSSGSSCFVLRRAIPVILPRTPRGNRRGTPGSPRHARFHPVTAQTAPTHWEADVLLRDGRAAHIRPIHAEDREV